MNQRKDILFGRCFSEAGEDLNNLWLILVGRSSDTHRIMTVQYGSNNAEERAIFLPCSVTLFTHFATQPYRSMKCSTASHVRR